jgi:hypothetical protein
MCVGAVAVGMWRLLHCHPFCALTLTSLPVVQQLSATPMLLNVHFTTGAACCCCCCCQIPTNRVKLLVGPGGATIKDIQRKSK